MKETDILEAGRQQRHYWPDSSRYREVFRVLAWRDLPIRYKQTVINVLWALVAWSHMLIFSLVFGHNRKPPGRWNHGLSADGVCRHIAVDVLLDRAERGVE
jgi:lipopolysaccharide transport system permease protein